MQRRFTRDAKREQKHLLSVGISPRTLLLKAFNCSLKSFDRFFQAVAMWRRLVLSDQRVLRSPTRSNSTKRFKNLYCVLRWFIVNAGLPRRETQRRSSNYARIITLLTGSGVRICVWRKASSYRPRFATCNVYNESSCSCTVSEVVQPSVRDVDPQMLQVIKESHLTWKSFM